MWPENWANPGDQSAGGGFKHRGNFRLNNQGSCGSVRVAMTVVRRGDRGDITFWRVRESDVVNPPFVLFAFLAAF